MNAKVSIIIPNYNGGATLDKNMSALKEQIHPEHEIIFVDDCSTDDSVNIARKYTNRVYRTVKNSGPAAARNLGIKESCGEFILFIDSDCYPSSNWIEKMIEEFRKNKNAHVVMGKVEIEKSNLFGDSISALGYPAGGSIGFEKIWPVSSEGFTSSFSTCNCGFRREIFDKYGLFDEDFPNAGGEDTLLAIKIFKGGSKIKYCPEVRVIHKARSSLASFVRWQISRGESIYIFKKKMAIRGKVKERLRAIRNILFGNFMDVKILLIINLIILSFICQQYGYLCAKLNDKTR